MSKCLDCTECRTVPHFPELATCRANIFHRIKLDSLFLSVERKCVDFEEEGINDNASGDQEPNK